MRVKNKQCKGCNKTLPAYSFYKQKRSKTGLQSLCKPCDHERLRARTYGLTLEELRSLIVQNHCDCCGRTKQEVGGDRDFCVEHSHESGVVRGYVCHYCNIAIGMLLDDPARAKKVELYLNKHHYDESNTLKQ
jgi:hypothetical protein